MSPYELGDVLDSWINEQPKQEPIKTVLAKEVNLWTVGYNQGYKEAYAHGWDAGARSAKAKAVDVLIEDQYGAINDSQ